MMRMYRKYKDILIFPTQCFYPLPNNMRYLTVADRFRYYDDATLAVHHWGVSWNENQRNRIIADDAEDVDDTKEHELQPAVHDVLEPECNRDSKPSIVETIMNDSSNLLLQSKIMSFLQ